MDFFSFTPFEIEAMRLSLLVAGWAVIFSLPFGVLAAWILARLEFPGKPIVDGLIHLPLVLPPVVTGYLLLVILGRKGIVGGWLFDTFGTTLAFHWKGAALASALMAFPLLVRAVRLSIEAVDQGLEAAARTMGAGPLRVFFTVTLPLMMPGVIAGVILAFARSLGEFGATITFVSNIPGKTQTLPLAIYTLTQVPDGEPAAMKLCLIAAGFSIAALVASDIAAKRFSARIRG
jgi:molybdate transport system permease protein